MFTNSTMQGISTLDWLDYDTGKSRHRFQYGAENDGYLAGAANDGRRLN
tara:strand:+ start:384 stop:530 length:147 start_codon:yes stop_codon:yes gene_type:complete